MEQVNDQRFDVEAQHAANVIAIYKAATGRGDASWCREPAAEQAQWERAAIAAAQIRQGQESEARTTLAQIGAVAACFGNDWPDTPGEPEILRRVKWAARQCAAASANAREASRALPAGMEPVGYLIDWPDEPELGHYFAEKANDGARSQPLHTAAQVQAMGRVPPGWQAVPVEPSGDMLVAIMSAGEVDVLRETPEKHQVLLIDRAGIPERYANLLAAAPQPPAAPAATEPQAPTTKAGSATAGAAPAYRLLQRDIDTIQADDEFLRDDAVTWQADPQGIFVGMAYMSNVLRPARRAIEPDP